MQQEPTVTKVSFLTTQALSFAELTEAALAHGLTAARFATVLKHRGLFLGRTRLDPQSPPAMIPAGSEIRIYSFIEEPTRIPLTQSDILDVDAGVVVVNKPAGIPVQGTRASIYLSLETQLAELLKLDWLTPVHRLDRETSGVILFATNPGAARELHAQFQERTVAKSYLAWVRPPPGESVFSVSGAMAQVPHPRHARYALVEASHPEGRASLTHFERLETVTDDALVCARPHTGRTHQIRVHLASVGSPILGDGLYGSPASAAAATRLLLHAQRLTVMLGAGRVPHEFVAPVPADFKVAR